MVLVFMESKSHAEPFALFSTEDAYMSNLKGLIAHASKHRMCISEKAEPSVRDIEKFIGDLKRQEHYEKLELSKSHIRSEQDTGSNTRLSE
jgi:hypothetical protein